MAFTFQAARAIIHTDREKFPSNIIMKGRLIILKQTIAPAAPDTQTQPMLMTKRIGSTTYRVTVHFSQSSSEGLNDKIMRLIRNDMAGGKVVVTN